MRIPRFIVINDSLGSFFWLTFVKIKLLSWYVALLVAIPHFFNTPEEVCIALLGAGKRGLEGCLNKNSEIPIFGQLRTKQEDPVKNKDGVSPAQAGNAQNNIRAKIFICVR